MATKSEYLTIRIPKQEKQRLAALARKERRTLSQVAWLMLEYAMMMKLPRANGQPSKESA